MPLGCDDFVFRKVYWPLPLRRGGWVGFRLTAKLSLSMTKPNCWCSLRLFCENSLWSSILNDFQTRVTLKNPNFCIFFSIYNSKEVGVLTNLIFLVFRLADDQKSFNAACSNIILHFCTAIMDLFIFKYSLCQISSLLDMYFK